MLGSWGSVRSVDPSNGAEPGWGSHLREATADRRPSHTWSRRSRSPGLGGRGWCSLGVGAPGQVSAALHSSHAGGPSRTVGMQGPCGECLALRHHTSGPPRSPGLCPGRLEGRVGTLEMTSGEETMLRMKAPWVWAGHSAMGQVQFSTGSAQCASSDAHSSKTGRRRESGCSGTAQEQGTLPTWARPDRAAAHQPQPLTQPFWPQGFS